MFSNLCKRSEKRALCLRLGATAFLDFNSDDVQASVGALTNGYGAHAVVCIAGMAAYKQAMRLVRDTSTLVCVGLVTENLPISHVGSFHNGPPDDPYQLPLEKTVSTCTVSVEMQHQGSSREAFSWFLLVEATLRLSKECLGPVLSPEHGAGVWIRLGNHRKIVTIVRYYKTLAERKHVATA